VRTPRIYLDHPLQPELTCTLPGEAAHHVIRVLRMKAGQPVSVFNGRGGEYDAEIIRADRNGVEIRVGAFRDRDSESCLDITLVQGISRSDRMDDTLRKAVELGVNRIIPVVSRYSQAGVDGSRGEKRCQRWRKISISACEQCGRNRLPRIERPVAFTDYLEGGNTGGLMIILLPAARTRLSRLRPAERALTLAAGPEGGFSEEEVAAAEKRGFHPVALGPRILRTETAALAAISACQALWGDMGGG